MKFEPMQLPAASNVISSMAAMANPSVRLPLAGSAVDLDHDGVRPEREGHVGRVVVVDPFEPWLHPVWEVRVGGERDVLDRLRALRRSLDDEAVHLPFEVVRRALEQGGG